MQTNEIEWFIFKEFARLIGNTMSAGTLRRLLLDRERNGVDYFSRKVGRRWLFNPRKFNEWVEGAGKK